MRPGSSRDVVITGCSGGGKSTLLAELASRGYATVPEPGRRIVREELRRDGAALPWVDPVAFAERAIEVAAKDRATRPDRDEGWRFHDRGLVDAAAALEHATGQKAATILAAHPPYHRRVFLAPSWPEIYRVDAERPHPIAQAMEEYERLVICYERLGYELTVLPRISVSQRAAFVLDTLGRATGCP